MHRLHYSGGTLLVADDVCRALMHYAQALADEGTADTVTIPVVEDDGTVTSADLLIGPASQLVSTEVPNMPSGGEDPEVVAELERRTSRLSPSRPAPENGAPWDGRAAHPIDGI